MAVTRVPLVASRRMFASSCRVMRTHTLSAVDPPRSSQPPHHFHVDFVPSHGAELSRRNAAECCRSGNRLRTADRQGPCGVPSVRAVWRRPGFSSRCAVTGAHQSQFVDDELDCAKRLSVTLPPIEQKTARLVRVAYRLAFSSMAVDPQKK